MKTLEQEIEELKKKHASLEVESYNNKLKKKYEKLKLLEGTVEVRIYKSSKITRHASIVHHVKYEMMKDDWKRETEKEHNFIGMHIRTIQVMESPRRPDRRYEIRTDEITPNSYNGKIHVEESDHSYDYSTHKTISVEDFEAIWNLAKITSANILDGILDVKDVKWLMTGSDEDFEFKDNEIGNYQKVPLDIPHIFLTQEESWKLNNKFTRIFLNKNIYLISPNSLLALDKWLEEEKRSDALSYSMCTSIGERWRGSRIDEYTTLVSKIKKAAK